MSIEREIDRESLERCFEEREYIQRKYDERENHREKNHSMSIYDYKRRYQDQESNR